MLEIKNLTKIYETAGFTQKALDNVSVCFRKCEFASILGQSGSGKTTFLNIIGGLDHYTSGDLIINEVSTKDYTDRDWDTYRNHRVGFVFQSYNLISHQSVLRNVELALTLSGVSKEERRVRALKALKDVGLEQHVNKRPNQLSGGQMQRVAIARALVNDPEIILADEPTGALDSETSTQIMDVLKSISKEKLVIMVTHNPELAKKYSNRIINIKDGHIISDSHPYDGKEDTKESSKVKTKKSKKTSMSFLTALSLSFNNLMTKKGRTILVAFAGSIGIIGIALILAVSTGFQNYVDSIQEDTLISYPLTIMKESVDITGMLLGLSGQDTDDVKVTGEKVIEKQQVSKTLASVKANDIKSLKKYLENNKDKLKKDVSSISYMYSVDPYIYTYDSTNTLAKVNPSDLFASMYNSNVLTSVGSASSIFRPMLNDERAFKEQYKVLKGRLPKNYDEIVIALPDDNSIPDLLVYSLGFRDNKELSEMINAIFRGEGISKLNEPLTLTYDELMSRDLRVILPFNLYKYNDKYEVYEDMSEDTDYMKLEFNKAIKLKIVGIVSAKSSSTSGSMNSGIIYKQELIDYIIDEASKTDIVKAQLNDRSIDVLSGNKFDEKNNTDSFTFSDLVSVDEEKLKDVFNINIDQNELARESENYINNINEAITTDTTPALETYQEAFNTILNNFKNSLDVDSYLNSSEVNNIVNNLEKEYYIPAGTYKTIYKGILEGILTAYNTAVASIPDTLPEETKNAMKDNIYTQIVNGVNGRTEVQASITEMAKMMTETKMKVVILKNVSDMSSNLTSKITNGFSIDPSKFASAFKLNFSEDELMRVVSAMTSEVSSADTNLLKLGYQDKEEPTMISIYFTSFEGKEHFVKFIKDYNEKVEESKKINYSDLTGSLMSSVKTIVNAVSYVLIAFVSISLVVSSIMIGVITYISVYERTKEIGILRSIGASKKNISSIFNAETVIIGFLSGFIGIGICYILIPIINSILHYYTGNMSLSAVLTLDNATLLIILSVILTLIGGLIPAKAASKRDPVEALRTE